MLTTKQFEGLKKTNLSIDIEKSKERISADFKAASAEVKNKIVELSGLTRATFYNAFQTGSASPKMVLALAQYLGVSPYYYTGESDEKGEFNDGVLGKFMKEKKLLVKTPAKKKAASAKPKAVKKAAVKKAPVKKAAAKTAVKKITAKKPVAKPAEKNVVPAKAAPKAAKKTARVPAKDEVLMQISIEKTSKLQKAVANLDEESAVLLFRALIRKADANDNAKVLCDIIKSCLLS